MMYGKYKMRGQYDTTNFIWLDITGGTRNITMGQGPQAIRINNGDLHVNNGYITMGNGSAIFMKGANNSWADIKIQNGWVDISPEETSNTKVGGINLYGRKTSIIHRGLNVITLTGDNNPSARINNANNMIVLTGEGSRKKIILNANQSIGTWYIIMSTSSKGYDIITEGSEYF